MRWIQTYDLRHLFTAKLLDNGADLKYVSSLLGHKSVQQTVDNTFTEKGFQAIA
jgi:site-specific recombinase XerD